MQYKIVEVEAEAEAVNGWIIVYYTVIGGKTRVVEVSERHSQKKVSSMEEKGMGLDSLAKSRTALLEAGHIAVRAPTT